MATIPHATVLRFYVRCVECRRDVGPFKIPAPAPGYVCLACRRTARRSKAVAALHRLADPLRFEVQAGDVVAFVGGRYGTLVVDAAGAIAVVDVSRRLFRRLAAIPGVDVDEDALETPGRLQAAVHPEAFVPVARLLRARRKPGVTSETARKVGSGTAFGGISGPVSGPPSSR